MVIISDVLWGSVVFCLGNLYPTVALSLWEKTFQVLNQQRNSKASLSSSWQWLPCVHRMMCALGLSPNSSTASVGCPPGVCRMTSAPCVGRRSLWNLMKKGSLKTPTSFHASMCILFMEGHLAFLKPVLGDGKSGKTVPSPPSSFVSSFSPLPSALLSSLPQNPSLYAAVHFLIETLSDP